MSDIYDVNEPLLTIPRKTVQNDDTKRTLYESLCSLVGNVFGCFGQIPFTPCFCCCYPMKIVQEGDQGLLMEFGSYKSTLPPGMHFVNPITQTIETADMRVNIIDNPSQVIMTKDNVTASIDSVLYYRVTNAQKSKFEIADFKHSIKELTQTALRDCLSKVTLQEALEHRDQLAKEIATLIDHTGNEWGVHIQSLLIKDIKVSKELQESLSAKAQAERMAAAKLISAEADVKAAILFREASDTLDTPAALQIRYLETLKEMTRNTGTKMIFVPMPSSPSSTSVQFPSDIVNYATVQALGNKNE